MHTRYYKLILDDAITSIKTTEDDELAEVIDVISLHNLGSIQISESKIGKDILDDAIEISEVEYYAFRDIVVSQINAIAALGVNINTSNDVINLF